MDGRIELENRYNNNINNLLAKEPEYLKRFNVYMSADDKTAKTKLNYINNVLRFVNYLKEQGMDISDEKKLRSINVNDVRLYLQMDDTRMINKRGKISDSYKYLRYFSLNCFMKFLEDEEVLDRNFIHKIKTPSNERQKKKVYLNVDEVKEIEKNVRCGIVNRKAGYILQWKERDEAIICLGFQTALRVSAIISINMENINWEEKCLSVIEKGNKMRHVYLGENTLTALENWIVKRNEFMNKRGFDTPALFISRKCRRISAQTVGNILRAYAGEINNGKRIVAHTMRSSTGTNTYLKTKDVRAAQMVLGHKSLAVTQRYINSTVEQQKELVNEIENLYAE